VFFPPPRVESAVIHVVRREPPAEAVRAIELAASGFGQRRKMLRRSLGAVVDNPERLLRAVGIDPTERAENLSPDDFVRLAAART
jgi:16S rRNA (adenine1518-N6/adenine1519-N6)-dimethyltransferase